MQSKESAPVALFVYNRPEHTKQTLEHLKKNAPVKDTILYVFADGPKAGATEEEKNNITETRAIIKNTGGFKELVLIEKEVNKGLAQSIIAGVTEIVNKHGKVIVLEDDLLVSPFFLDFMNEGLEMYASSPNVYSVNGFMYPLNYPEQTIVLLPYTSTWGWATWKDKWDAFSVNMNGKEFLKANPFLAARFNLGHYDYTDMLHFENNSWGIKWYFSVFARGGLNVYSTKTLVSNIGFDGSGTNKGNSHEGRVDITQDKIAMTLQKTIDMEFFSAFANYFKKENISLLRRSINLFKRTYKKLK
jgi:hypothetical protein